MLNFGKRNVILKQILHQIISGFFKWSASISNLTPQSIYPPSIYYILTLFA